MNTLDFDLTSFDLPELPDLPELSEILEAAGVTADPDLDSDRWEWSFFF